MRQFIALVDAGRVKFAVVDDGEITEFAQVLVPAHFGIVEAATLGTNLAEALGLNGPQPAREPKARAAQQVHVAQQPRAAKRSPQVRGAANRKANQNTGRYISDEMVTDIVNAHPRPITIPEVARILAERDGLDYVWCRMSVNNRLVNMRQRVAAGRTDRMPFQETRRRDPKRNTEQPLLSPWPENAPAQVTHSANPELQVGLQS